MLSKLSNSCIIATDKIQYFIFKKLILIVVVVVLVVVVVVVSSINSRKCPFMWKYSFITILFFNWRSFYKIK